LTANGVIAECHIRPKFSNFGKFFKKYFRRYSISPQRFSKKFPQNYKIYVRLPAGRQERAFGDNPFL